MPKKTVAYLSVVGWNGIRQRTQYIAEELAKVYEVTVYDQIEYQLIGKIANDAQSVTVRHLPKIPTLNGRLVPAKFLNRTSFAQLARACIARRHPEIIWLTHPSQYRAIPKSFSGTVVYDCMDDHVSFSPGKHNDKIRDAEWHLVNRADVVIVSSEKLSQNIIYRYGTAHESKIHLIRNGFSPVSLNESHRHNAGDIYKLGYFGTVSDWFDWDAVLHAVERVEGAEMVIIGPVLTRIPTRVSENSRIHFVGPVDHDRLSEVTEDIDCLVMPFKLNDLILAVDPVKLYEYICLGKDIICVEYPEVERFREFVYFYNGSDGFMNAVLAARQACERKYGSEAREKFLSRNTWSQRGAQIQQILDV